MVKDDINGRLKNKKFMAVSENLDKLNDYRCSSVHYCDDKLDPIIFMIIAKAVLNYDIFIKKYFNKDITKNDNLIILPIGLKLPFDPIDYLKQDYGKAHNDFVNEVVHSIRLLDEAGIQDSIVIGFNLVTDKVRDEKNADIIASLSNTPEAVALRRAIRITDSPNAPVFKVEEPILPLTYHDVQDEVKNQRPDIKFNKKYNDIMRTIKTDSTLCQTRYLDPKKKSGVKKEFYSRNVIDEIIKRYDGGDEQ